MTWEQYHALVIKEMERLLKRWGRRDSYDLATLRRAEIVAIRLVRKGLAAGGWPGVPHGQGRLSASARE